MDAATQDSTESFHMATNEQPSRKVGRAVFKGVSYALIGIVIAAAISTLALIMVRNYGGVRQVVHTLMSLRLYGYAIQFSLIATLWWKWDHIVNWMVDRKTLPEAARPLLLARRHRWMLSLFLFEVFMLVFTTPTGVN
ncbi:MAG: hypothetical protein EKK47_20365 [Burkholderiales bacterium]|nr:MAG: hypothetical protein EKK47_20365 [Burkholderiales bacterium]